MKDVLLTVSGVHGVGKSALCQFLAERYTLSVSPGRPTNPFSDPFHSMLFFIVAYSARDRGTRTLSRPAILDRLSFYDIAIYIETLKVLEEIDNSQYRALAQANSLLLEDTIRPTVAILLVDSLDSVLHRLRMRGGKPGHIYEHDPVFLNELNRLFIVEFTEGSVTRRMYSREAPIPGIPMLIDVGARSLDDVGNELLGRLAAAGVSFESRQA